MSAISDLIKGGAAGILGGIGDAAIKIREAIRGKEISPELTVKLQEIAASLETQALEVDRSLAAAQIDLAKTDAQSGDAFQRRWRPALGWVFVAAIAYQFVVRPLAPWLATVCGAMVPDMPALDTAELWPMLIGMLGLGGMRTYEKVAKK